MVIAYFIDTRGLFELLFCDEEESQGDYIVAEIS
jgi:hypothetical protein